MAGKDVKAHVLVRGKVQGVYYRVWAKSNAKDLNLNGWVKNSDDGSVEAEFEGDPENIDEMIKRMRTGSELAQVDDVDFDFSEATGEFSEFQIIN